MTLSTSATIPEERFVRLTPPFGINRWSRLPKNQPADSWDSLSQKKRAN